jgi:multimeric flavodoxin WrbA
LLFGFFLDETKPYVFIHVSEKYRFTLGFSNRKFKWKIDEKSKKEMRVAGCERMEIKVILHVVRQNSPAKKEIKNMENDHIQERIIMNTLLGIIASPRKFGNSELFVKELYRQLPEGWLLNLVRLPELDIRPCRACYKCLFGEMECPQEDDFHLILQALVESDAYVVAAPTYFLGANASLKRLLDRGLTFYAHIEALWGKPAVGVAIAGIEGKEGYTKLMVDSFIKLTLADHRGSAVMYGAIPGEIFLDNGGRETAKGLAEALVYGALEKNPTVPICPLCAGDTFRFLPDGQVRCMLCSSSGSYQYRDNRLWIHTHPGEHPFFLSYEDAFQHADWLRGMKEKFLARRKEFKTIAQQYTREGTWLQTKREQ